MSNYFKRLGNTMSQFFNVLLLNGDANESISGRSYRCGWWSEKYIDMVFSWFGDEDHSMMSHVNELKWANNFIKKKRERGIHGK